MAATARPDQAAPAAAPDSSIHDVVRMAKGAIQEQQERQQSQSSQQPRVSPFQSPDAAAHLGAHASAAYARQPSPQNLSSRSMQQQLQQQQRPQQRKQKGSFLWRLITCSCCSGPAVHDDVLEPLGPRNSLPPQLPPSASIASRLSGTLQPRFSGLRPKSSTSFTDADWCDAKSDATWSIADQDLSVGPVMPDPPLYFQDKPLTFVNIPEKTPFGGYWLRDEVRTTPNPQPIDVMLGDKWLVKKVHGSIPGIYLHETPTKLEVRVRPRFLPPGLGRYCEYYNKDGSETSWGLRRDLQPGRSFGRMFMTACGLLVFRVYTKPLFSDTIDTICEEYMLMEQRPGQPPQIIARQCCFHVATERTASQYLAGNYLPEPPKGHAW